MREGQEEDNIKKIKENRNVTAKENEIQKDAKRQNERECPKR